MSNCKKCGKPLIVSEGKCVYCGSSVGNNGGSSSSKKSNSTPWYKKIGFSEKDKGGTWLGRLFRKCLIATIVALVFAVVAILVKPWPGCLISAELLWFVIILGICSIILTQSEIQEGLVSELGEKKTYTMLNFVLNLILIWGYFFCVVGTAFWMFDYAWWAILIAEIIGAIGLVVIPILASTTLSEYV